MTEIFKRIASKSSTVIQALFRKTKPDDGLTSYAQTGEDIIVHRVLTAMKIQQPTYLDIGAFHPIKFSNTMFFYERGSKGVCVEPDPQLCESFNIRRPRDICLNVGVGIKSESDVPFFLMSPASLSTFSESEARRIAAYEGYEIDRIISVPILGISTILEDFFDTPPDFVSLDIEGNELEVLQGIDFAKCRPAVFCIETITFTPDYTGHKNEDISALLSDGGYLAIADTYVNTIYVNAEQWPGTLPALL